MIPTDFSESIRRAAALWKHATYGVAFTGAGISTASGIPDFRSHDSGLWSNVDPMVVASIYGFRNNPEAFYNWVRPLTKITMEAEPNAAHYVLAELETRGYIKAVVTQNIDMLHTRAGSQTVYELHGHMREATCIHCFEVYPCAPIMNQFLEDGLVPHCSHCGGVLKPNVILFGEQLPIRELQASQNAARKSDLMIVVGSSLEVYPASEIPMMAKRAGAKLVIVNLEPTPADEMADVLIHANAAEVLPEIMRRMETI
jgi:NAD-dependent deacetylase